METLIPLLSVWKERETRLESQIMQAEKTLLKINPIQETVSDFSKTRPLSSKAVLEDISVSRSAYLEIHLPGLKPITFELDELGSMIGRCSDCRIQLQLPHVSRMHARVSRFDEEFLIEDLESTNGTFVNGVRIHKCVLRNNDQIQIGEAKILYIEALLSKNGCSVGGEETG